MRIENALSRISRFTMLASLLFAFMGTVTDAQPNLNFKRTAVNWPTIELYFMVGCDGNPAYNMAKQDFRIFENDVEVTNFTLWCPDPMLRCAISVSMVFDASGSMSTARNAGAKQAGNAFVDLMDGIADEATVMWYSSYVTVYQQMTTNKPMLYTAIDALPAGGATAWRDGAYAGILELINDGVNQCRAVILMTDGGDNASSRTFAEIVSLANRHRIRVFTVGLGSGLDVSDLENLALLTGGRYYQTPNASQLAAIYAEIWTIITQGFQECIITYERDCADGGMRTVELQLENFCGGTDVKTKTYLAPRDSTTYSNLYMELGRASGKGNTDITIPLNLITPVNGEMFFPFEYTLQYDSQCVQFKSVVAPPGSLLEGSKIDVVPAANGTLIRVSDGKVLNGNGKLMDLTFTASDPLDTVCCEIEGIDPKFDQGCFTPIIDPGEICISPRVPVVTCLIDGPLELTWQVDTREYAPNPFPVTMRISNDGDKEAQNVQFRIVYDTNDVQLVSPLSDVQAGLTKDLFGGGFNMEAIWQVAATERTDTVSTEICIVASFDNHEDVVCCLQVTIPPTGPKLECGIDIPDIVFDTGNDIYIPMPFPVTATVTNTGGMSTEGVYATLHPVGDLSLVPGEAAIRVLDPVRLSPQEQGTAQWLLEHPLSTVERQYTLQVWVRTNNADSVLCEENVIIPAICDPFDIELTAEGPLVFCEGDSVTLDAGSGYATYRWSSGESTRSIEVWASGVYSVTVS
ncbi:MAG: VWA domain-containing protein, partial [Bacteroidetes bacterium]|nr:VWA domain-containing protein [Bacteroidota bacterium]